MRSDALPHGVINLTTWTTDLPLIRDANIRPVEILGWVRDHVNLSSKSEVPLYVVECLEPTVILGCDFCDMHIESIRPCRHIVDLHDGTTVLIIREQPKRTVGSTELPYKEIYVAAEGRVSDKTTIGAEVTLAPAFIHGSPATLFATRSSSSNPTIPFSTSTIMRPPTASLRSRRGTLSTHTGQLR